MATHTRLPRLLALVALVVLLALQGQEWVQLSKLRKFIKDKKNPHGLALAGQQAPEGWVLV